jgi:hypothetical protein
LAIGYIGNFSCVSFVGGGQWNENVNSQLGVRRQCTTLLLFGVINGINLVEKSSFFVPLSSWTAQSTILDGLGFVSDCV